MTAAFSDPEPTPPGDAWAEGWVVVVEFACRGDDRPIRFDDLHKLLEELAWWHPAALWADDRYAIQLRIPAYGHSHALKVAVDSYQQALQAVGLPPSTMVRAEVLTAEEMDRTFLDQEVAETLVWPTGSDMHCAEVYAATRDVLAAATATEVSESVDRFVTAVGARVEPGAASHLPTMTDVDLDGIGGPTRHATAEALSVAGLLLEQSLPNLVVDARRALARLQRHTPHASLALLPPTDVSGGGPRSVSTP